MEGSKNTVDARALVGAALISPLAGSANWGYACPMRCVPPRRCG